MTEHFAPGVVIDGVTVYPEGWMWVLGFALAGCEWAIVEAERMNLRECARDYGRRRKLYFAELHVGQCKAELALAEGRLTALKAQIRIAGRVEDQK